ncbi:hypothetical protein [Pseudomonas batumici]|uniref:hypothetical protein n=1 Tax=Pseudomonas batumici TaxID=226910 RepID=UPI000589CE65|nr:hypothetical protein [Pseudomonas batumici]
MRPNSYTCLFAALLSTVAQADDLSVKEELISQFKEATNRYHKKSDDCLLQEKTKTAITPNDLSPFKKSEAVILLGTEIRQRLKTCIEAEESIAIRKHLELLDHLTSKEKNSADFNTYSEILSTYFGIDDNFDRERHEKYKKIAQAERDKFLALTKDKNLQVKLTPLIEHLTD